MLATTSIARSGLILLGYGGLGLYFLQFNRYGITPDGISYISIAQKYLDGNVGDAVNGYWGPLLSWLLVPVLALGVPPVLAPKLVLLVTGMMTIVGARLLSYRFDMSESVRTILLVSLIPVTCYFALFRMTPDLLIATTLLFYLAFIFDSAYRTHAGYGWRCGVVGGLSFFAKSFGFPFFLVHFLIFNGLHYVNGRTPLEKRTVLRNGVSGLVVFCMLSGGWVLLISRKYQEFTITTTPAVNYAAAEGGGFLFLQRLLEPPNETAVSYWEDPYFALKADRERQARDGTTSVTAALHSESSIPPSRSLPARWANTSSRSYEILQSFSVFSVVVILASVFASLLSARRHRILFHSLLTLAVYSGGYILIFVEPRYLWIEAVLLVMMGTHLLAGLLTLKNAVWYRATVTGLLVVFVGSFSVSPLQYLIRQKWQGRSEAELSEKLKPYNTHGRIASDINWGPTMYLAFYNNFKYYGLTGHGEGGRDIRKELRDNDIDYYFVWNRDFKVDSDATELTEGQKLPLRIYRLKPNAE